MRSAALFLLVVATGCSTLRVSGENGAAYSRDDTKMVLEIFADEAKVPVGYLLPLLVQYDTLRHPHDDLGDKMMIVGLTDSPYHVWLIVDKYRKDACTQALAHELIHVLKWRAVINPDAAHTGPEWGAAPALEGRVVARVCAARPSVQ